MHPHEGEVVVFEQVEPVMYVGSQGKKSSQSCELR